MSTNDTGLKSDSGDGNKISWLLPIKAEIKHSFPASSLVIKYLLTSFGAEKGCKLENFDMKLAGNEPFENATFANLDDEIFIFVLMFIKCVYQRNWSDNEKK